MKQLHPLSYLLAAIFLGIGILAFGTIYWYLPNETLAGYWQANAQKEEAEANKLPAAKRRLQTAQEMVESKAAAWKVFAKTKTPPGSLKARGIDLDVNAWQLSVDVQEFRNNIQRAVNAQVIKGGIQVVAGPYIPDPGVNDQASGLLTSYFNFPTYPFPVVIFDLGTITVRGTYKQIENNVEAWSSMPHYLAVTDGLHFDGTAPILTGTYNLTLVGFINATTIYPNVPEGAAGGTSTAPGGPGGIGGPPGGLPPGVGPPGGFGGAPMGVKGPGGPRGLAP